MRFQPQDNIIKNISYISEANIDNLQIFDFSIINQNILQFAVISVIISFIENNVNLLLILSTNNLYLIKICNHIYCSTITLITLSSCISCLYIIIIFCNMFSLVFTFARYLHNLYTIILLIITLNILYKSEYDR